MDRNNVWFFPNVWKGACVQKVLVNYRQRLGNWLVIYFYHTNQNFIIQIIFLSYELSQPLTLLTCSALIIFNISWSLNWKEGHSTVGVFDTGWSKVLPLFSEVHFDAKKKPLKWFAFFPKADSNLSCTSKGGIDESFCNYKMFSLLRSKFWDQS